VAEHPKAPVAREEPCPALLRDSELAIGEIATELGYADSAHFTRAFEAWQQINPSRFRALANAADT